MFKGDLKKNSGFFPMSKLLIMTFRCRLESAPSQEERSVFFSLSPTGVLALCILIFHYLYFASEGMQPLRQKTFSEW